MTTVVHEREASALSAAPVPTMVEHFWRRVAERSDRPALLTRSEGRWSATTWAEFGRLTRALAAFLIDDGARPGEHAAIWSANRAEWHVADTAILSAGLTLAPVYHTLSGPEVTHVLGHSESVVVFVDTTATLRRLEAVRGALPALRRAVVFEGAPEGGDGVAIGWGEALARGRAALQGATAAELDRRIAAVSPDDVATLVYTSGTTGPPKGVMLTHRNLDAAVHSLTAVIPVTPDDRVISYLPLAHIAERLASELRQYTFGNAVHFCPSVADLPGMLREVRPTFMVGVPRVWEKIAHRIEGGVSALPRRRRAVARWALAQGLRAVDRAQQPLPLSRLEAARLRLADRLVLRKIREEVGLDQATVLISAAAPIGAATLRMLHAVGLAISEHYGMSEDTGATSVNPIGHARLGTVGPPLPGVEVRIADDGEILVRGGVVFAGYFKDEEATREALADGWLHTGDVGHLDERGFLSITDRKKDLLITAGGKNISPSNIEGMLEAHPVIATAVAIGDRRPYISALITVDREAAAELARHVGVEADPASLGRHPLIRDAVDRHVAEVNSHLAQVEQVKRWELLDGDFTVGVELTPTFKVRRRVVAERYAEVIERNYQ